MSHGKVAQLKAGDLVRLDGKPTLYRVVDFHGPLARIAPVARTGRIVHPERLVKVEGER